MASPFSTALPITAFQVWFVYFLYLLPFLLYATWASIAMMDLSERTDGTNRIAWGAVVMLVPLVGGACYVLSAASLKRPARIAIVVAGLVVWLLPSAVGLWLAGGPLGPKALS